MRSVLAAAAAVCLGATSAAAQRPELARRVDSLARIAREAGAAVEAYDAATRRTIERFDTVLTGTPLVLSEARVAEVTRSAASHIRDSVSRVLGAGQARLAGYTFVVHAEDAVSWRGGRRDTTLELSVSVVGPDGSRHDGWRSVADSAAVSRSLRYAMLAAALGTTGTFFTDWAAGAVAMHPVRPAEWATHRLRLISSPSAVGPRCYRGDIGACKRVLSLVATADPLTGLHDSLSRRRLVDASITVARRIDDQLATECLAGSDTACVSLLRQYPPEGFGKPVAPALRVGLLRHALAVGGDRAVERLVTSTANDPAERLAYAAGVPIDSLLTSWHRRVRDTRAPSRDLSFGLTLMTLGWVTGLGVISLRSSRWR